MTSSTAVRAAAQPARRLAQRALEQVGIGVGIAARWTLTTVFPLLRVGATAFACWLALAAELVGERARELGRSQWLYTRKGELRLLAAAAFVAVVVGWILGRA